MKKINIFILFIIFFTQTVFAYEVGTVLVAGGSDSSNTRPFISVSNDGNGKIWNIKSLPNLTISGAFLATTCAGNLCVAAGKYFEFSSAISALLYISTDRGENWSIKSVPNLSADTQFYTVSCSGSDVTAVCMAAGTSSHSETFPILIVSVDGGNNWVIKNVPDLPIDGAFIASSCTGSGSNAICAAVGDKYTREPSFLVVSSDGGNTWAVKNVPALTRDAHLNGISCTGHAISAVCTAVGHINNFPLLIKSTDGGNTWKLNFLPKLPSRYGQLTATSCTGNGSSAICTAAGQTNDENAGIASPLLLVSTDGANKWFVKSIPGLKTSGSFKSTSCAGSGTSAVCIAAGDADEDKYPVLLTVSTDGGNNWKIKSIPGESVKGHYNVTGCTGSGAAAICMAAGSVNSNPLLVMSLDGGNTWSRQYEGVPERGDFYGVGGTL